MIFTEREKAVILLARREDLNNVAIARLMSVDESTVRDYFGRVFKKLGVSNRSELTSKVAFMNADLVLDRWPSDFRPPAYRATPQMAWEAEYSLRKRCPYLFKKRA